MLSGEITLHETSPIISRSFVKVHFLRWENIDKEHILSWVSHHLVPTHQELGDLLRNLLVLAL